jgi:anti-anti-sigma factor
MLNFKFEKAGDFGILSFDGELTAQHADRLKEALMVSLDNAEHVVVNFEKVSEIDVDCLFLFYTTWGMLARLKKRLTLTGISPEMYKRVEEFIGYDIPITRLMSSDVSSIAAEG